MAETSPSERPAPEVARNLVARLDRLPVTRLAVGILILVELAWIIEGIDIGVVGPVTATLKKLWHLDASQTGLAGTMGTLGIVVGLFPAGRLADRIGRKRVLVWGVAQFSLFSILTALAPSYGWYLLLRFFGGIGQGCIFALPYLYIAEYLRPGKRGAVIGWQNGVLAFSYVVPSALAVWTLGSFSSNVGWRILLLLAGLPVLYAPVLARYLPESPRWLIQKGRLAEAEALVERLEKSAGIAPDMSLTIPVEVLTEQRASVRELFKSPYLARSVLAYSSYTGGLILWYTVLVYGVLIFREAGFANTSAILVLALMMGIACVGEVIQGYLSDWLGRKALQAVYGFAAAIAGALVAAFPSGGPVLGLLTAIAFFGLGMYPVQKMYIAEQYPTNLRGLGTSAGEGIGRFLGGVLAAYYIPAILAAWGVRGVFIFTSIALAILITPMLLWGRETARLSVDITGSARGSLSPDIAGTGPEQVENKMA